MIDSSRVAILKLDSNLSSDHSEESVQWRVLNDGGLLYERLSFFTFGLFGHRCSLGWKTKKPRRSAGALEEDSNMIGKIRSLKGDIQASA